MILKLQNKTKLSSIHLKGETYSFLLRNGQNRIALARNTKIHGPALTGRETPLFGLVVESENDPSAGSPTETLLRLLLPLDVKI
jgi:hypothetical protein